MKLLNLKSTPSVFATANFARTEYGAGGERRLPASEIHAKVMGTTTTLCGRSTLSWFKFWDIAFVSAEGPRCPACTTALHQHLAAGDAIYR
jgi:hypothetical protein